MELVSVEKMKEDLRSNKCKVTFTKQDGTVRDMLCTLMEAFIIPQEKKTERVKTPSENTLAVWDLEKNAWRSFRTDSVSAFQVL